MVRVFSNNNGLFLQYTDENDRLSPEEYWKHRKDSLIDIFRAVEKGEYTHFVANALDRLKRAITFDLQNAYQILEKMKSKRRE